MATLEEEMARLNPIVRPCNKHNNPAHIEADIQGEFILASECGCYMETNMFDSLADAVNWWNDRPYLDSLMGDYIAEVEKGRKWKKMFESLMGVVESLARVFTSMAESRSISVIALEQARGTSKLALEMIEEYRASDLAKGE